MTPHTVGSFERTMRIHPNRPPGPTRKSLLVRSCAPRASFPRHLVRGLPLHRHMARLSRHALEPAADLGKAGEVIVAGVRQMGIGIKRDVSDGVAAGHEIAVMPEVMLHHGNRALTFLDPILDHLLL